MPPTIGDSFLAYLRKGFEAFNNDGINEISSSDSLTSKGLRAANAETPPSSQPATNGSGGIEDMFKGLMEQLASLIGSLKSMFEEKKKEEEKKFDLEKLFSESSKREETENEIVEYYASLDQMEYYGRVSGMNGRKRDEFFDELQKKDPALYSDLLRRISQKHSETWGQQGSGTAIINQLNAALNPGAFEGGGDLIDGLIPLLKKYTKKEDGNISALRELIFKLRDLRKMGQSFGQNTLLSILTKAWKEGIVEIPVSAEEMKLLKDKQKKKEEEMEGIQKAAEEATKKANEEYFKKYGSPTLVQPKPITKKPNPVKVIPDPIKLEPPIKTEPKPTPAPVEPPPVVLEPEPMPGPVRTFRNMK